MATLTKTWTFNSDLESWSTSGTTNRITTDGYPDNGCLYITAAGRNTTVTPTVSWTGTYESLGIPSGSIITGLQGSLYFKQDITGSVADAYWDLWYDATNSLVTSPNDFTSIAWGLRTGTAVTGLSIASTANLALTLDGYMRCANDKTAVINMYWDTISVEITYTPPFVAPTVSSSAATGIDLYEATLNGNLTSLGDATTVDRFFEWREVGAGTWNTTTKNAQTTTGVFSQAITGLDHSTDYEFRAVAEYQDGGTQAVYGSTLTFSTTFYDNISLSGTFSTDTRAITDITVPVRVVEIERQTNLGTWDPLIILFDTDPLAYTDTNNLQSGNNYCYRIRKWTSEISSDWSNTDCVEYSVSEVTTFAAISQTGTRTNLNVDLILPPSVTTNAATTVGSTVATLNGTLDIKTHDSTDVFFQYRKIGTTEPTITTSQEAMVDYLIANVPSMTSHVAYAYNPATDAGDVTTTKADHLLTWQMDGSGTGVDGTKGSPDHNGIGGWTKDKNNLIYYRDWDGSEAITSSWRSGTMTNENGTSTLDNDATVRPIQYLAAVYGLYGGTTYQTAAWKAIEMIFTMQHTNGSFMESYPSATGTSTYPNQGIINDEVHTNVMHMFRKILNGVYPFDNDFFSAAQKAEIQTSYDNALDFLIQAQTQRTANGKREIWASTYTANTYTPQWHRHMEPPGNMDAESSFLTYMLIGHTSHTDETKRAIYYAALWAYEHALVDTAYRNNTAPYFYTSAGDITWYRFTEFDSNNVGIFADDWVVYYDMADLSTTTRTTYLWGTESFRKLYDATKTYIDTNGVPTEPSAETVSYDWINTTTQTLTASGSFQQELTGLDSSEDYEFRAAVTHTGQTYYGTTLTFSTSAGSSTLSCISQTDSRSDISIDSLIDLAVISQTSSRSSVSDLNMSTNLSMRSITDSQTISILNTAIKIINNSQTETRTEISTITIINLTLQTVTPVRSISTIDTLSNVQIRAPTENRTNADLSTLVSLSGLSSNDARTNVEIQLIQLIDFSGISQTTTYSQLTFDSLLSLSGISITENRAEFSIYTSVNLQSITQTENKSVLNLSSFTNFNLLSPTSNRTFLHFELIQKTYFNLFSQTENRSVLDLISLINFNLLSQTSNRTFLHFELIQKTYFNLISQTSNRDSLDLITLTNLNLVSQISSRSDLDFISLINLSLISQTSNIGFLHFELIEKTHFNLFSTTLNRTNLDFISLINLSLISQTSDRTFLHFELIQKTHFNLFSTILNRSNLNLLSLINLNLKSEVSNRSNLNLTSLINFNLISITSNKAIIDLISSIDLKLVSQTSGRAFLHFELIEKTHLNLSSATSNRSMISLSSFINFNLISETSNRTDFIIKAVADIFNKSISFTKADLKYLNTSINILTISNTLNSSILDFLSLIHLNINSSTQTRSFSNIFSESFLNLSSTTNSRTIATIETISSLIFKSSTNSSVVLDFISAITLSMNSVTNTRSLVRPYIIKPDMLELKSSTAIRANIVLTGYFTEIALRSVTSSISILSFNSIVSLMNISTTNSRLITYINTQQTLKLLDQTSNISNASIFSKIDIQKISQTETYSSANINILTYLSLISNTENQALLKLTSQTNFSAISETNNRMESIIKILTRYIGLSQTENRVNLNIFAIINLSILSGTHNRAVLDIRLIAPDKLQLISKTYNRIDSSLLTSIYLPFNNSSTYNLSSVQLYTNININLLTKILNRTNVNIESLSKLAAFSVVYNSSSIKINSITSIQAVSSTYNRSHATILSDINFVLNSLTNIHTISILNTNINLSLLSNTSSRINSLLLLKTNLKLSSTTNNRTFINLNLDYLSMKSITDISSTLNLDAKINMSLVSQTYSSLWGHFELIYITHMQLITSTNTNLNLLYTTIINLLIQSSTDNRIHLRITPTLEAVSATSTRTKLNLTYLGFTYKYCCVVSHLERTVIFQEINRESNLTEQFRKIILIERKCP